MPIAFSVPGARVFSAKKAKVKLARPRDIRAFASHVIATGQMPSPPCQSESFPSRTPTTRALAGSRASPLHDPRTLLRAPDVRNSNVTPNAIPPPTTHDRTDLLMSTNPDAGAADALRAANVSPASEGPAALPTMDQMDAVHSQQPAPDPPYTPGHMSSALPADDGMHALREKMLEVHYLAVSTEEKARRMHAIMTQDYLARRANAVRDNLPSRLAPTRSGETPPLPGPDNPYNLGPADFLPSYHPDIDPTLEQEPLQDGEGDVPWLGCIHYKRNVKVQCFDCRLWFSCRHCHDASPDLPFPHTLNRNKTENMLCMLCHTPQSANEICVNCGEDAAYYYCDKCKLWDNDSSKRIYHCDDCGICRRGEGLGKDYVHCKRCNVCISISTSSTHPCIERATDCDCPLCLDYLFSSSSAVVSLLCGHYMHAACYKDLMNTTYRCPVCNKSAVNMELQWRKLDEEIRLQPMPEEDCESGSEVEHDISAGTWSDQGMVEGVRRLSLGEAAPPRPRRRRRLPKMVWIGCNDCGGRSWTVFHWLGLKCIVCDGYNTSQMVYAGDSNSNIRAPLPEPQTQRHHDFTGVDVLRNFTGGVTPDLDQPLQTTLHPDFDSAHGSEPTLPSQRAAQPSYHPEDRTPMAGHGPRRSRSYFLQAEREAELQRRNSSSAQESNSAFDTARLYLPSYDIRPYDILQRFGRSLSPMRYYLDGLDSRDSAGGAAGAAAKGGEAAAAASRSFNPPPLPPPPPPPGSIPGPASANGSGSALRRRLRFTSEIQDEPEQGSANDAVFRDDDDSAVVDFWAGAGHYARNGEDEDGSISESSEDEDDDESDQDPHKMDEMELFGHM